MRYYITSLLAFISFLCSAQKGVISVSTVPGQFYIPIYRESGWTTRREAELTIEDFGAIPNSIVSASINLTAFNNSLASLNVARIPAGDYYVSGTIALKDTTRVIGLSSKSFLIYTGTSTLFKNVFNGGNSHIVLEGFSIRATAAATSAIYLVNGKNVTIQNVFADGNYSAFTTGGIIIEGKDTLGQNTYNISIRDCYFNQCNGWGLKLQGAGAGGLINVENSQFGTCGTVNDGVTGGIKIQVDPPFRAFGNLCFTNVNVQGTPGIGFLCEGVSGLYINGLYVENVVTNTVPMVQIGKATGTYCEGIHIMDCTLITPGTKGVEILSGVRDLELYNNFFSLPDTSTAAVTGECENLRLISNQLAPFPTALYLWNNPANTASFITTIVEDVNYSSPYKEKSTNKAIPQNLSTYSGNVLISSLDENAAFFRMPLKIGSTATATNNMYRSLASPNGVLSASSGDVCLSPDGFFQNAGTTVWNKHQTVNTTPVWTTGTRPTPLAGEYPLGFNTTTSKHEAWDGSAWNNLY